MGQYFAVTVTEANGRVKQKVCAVGGGSISAEELADRYVRINAFPGAKEVTIQEATGSLPKSIVDAIAERRLRQLGRNVRPLTTPRAKILNPEERMPADNPEERELRNSIDHSGPLDSTLPASPVSDSQESEAARREAEAAGRAPEPGSGAAGSQGGSEAQQGPPTPPQAGGSFTEPSEAPEKGEEPPRKSKK